MQVNSWLRPASPTPRPPPPGSAQSQSSGDRGGRRQRMTWFITIGYGDEAGYRRTPEGWRIARRALSLRGLEVRPLDHLGPGR